jgi:hypothetical protein
MLKRARPELGSETSMDNLRCSVYTSYGSEIGQQEVKDVSLVRKTSINCPKRAIIAHVRLGRVPS